MKKFLTLALSALLTMGLLTAASILQDRVDAQAEGGAWYPESMETWSNAQVVQNGTYVAMIATADHQEEIAEQFNALFA